jgi:hypothetical protein
VGFATGTGNAVGLAVILIVGATDGKAEGLGVGTAGFKAFENI